MSQSAFAKGLLEKQGWKEGDGLGKNNDGISKPVKSSLKFDKTGVGHDPGLEFTDHWWLRVYNDAASSIKKPNEVTEEVKKSPLPQNKLYNGFIRATEEVTKSPLPQNKLYKGFTKGSVLRDGEEKDCSDDEEETEATKDSSRLPTLDDIHKFCGGATGSRAGAMGFKLKGKLSRAAEQERLYNEHSTKKKTKRNNEEAMKEKKKSADAPDIVPPETNGELNASPERKEKKKKRKREKSKNSENCDDTDEHAVKQSTETPESDETPRKKKKKKKEKRQS